MFVGYLCETMTGTVGPRVDLLGGSCERVLSGIGTWQATIPGAVAMNVPAKWIYPWISSLLVMHVDRKGNEVPWGFGPITSLPSATSQGPQGDADMNVQISGHDFRALLSRRYVTALRDVADSSTNERSSDGKLYCQKQSVRWSGCSLGSIARCLVQRATQRKNGSLPISYVKHRWETGLSRDDGHTREYYGWNVANNGIDKLLSELTACENGPQIDFRPFYNAGSAMTADTAGVYFLAGTEADPDLPQSRDYTWDLTRPNSPACIVSWDTSAEEMYTRSWATGEGSEADQKIDYWNNDTMHNRGFPLLEQVNAYSSVKNTSTLNAHAREDGKVAEWPVVQATIDLDPYHADTKPGAWFLGDRVNLRYLPTLSFLDHAYLHLPAARHNKVMAYERYGTIFNAHADFTTGKVTVKVELS